MKISFYLACFALLTVTCLNSFSQNSTEDLFLPSNCLASNRAIVVMQSDSSSISIVGKGNMNQNWTETTDGYTIIPVNGIYEYAQEQNGKLISTGIRAHDVGNRTLNELSLLSRLQKSQKPEAVSLKGTVLDQARKMIKNKNFPTTGNVRVLALLIDFPDLQNTYSTSDFDSLFNSSNHHNGDGSFASYYDSSSNGQLKIRVDVYGWYTASNGYLYYADSSDTPYKSKSKELVRNAVDSAELAGVDFSQYDNNNDGYVDGILTVHAGPGAEEGSQTQYIWSHRHILFNTVMYDNTYIYDYMMNPETRGGIAKNLVGIGVFCHEFGHNLGLPDLYDTDNTNGDSEGIGEFGLMGSGGWLGGEHQPGNFSAWSRIELGWENPKTLTIGDSGFYSLNHTMFKNEIFKIPHLTDNTQYFLLENRQNLGLDVDLPGEGLAIWHINARITSNGYCINCDENNKGVDLEEADGDDDLDNSANRGDDGDLFPGNFSATSFNDRTYPSAMVNSRNSGIQISNIREYKDVVYFTWGSINPYLTVLQDTLTLNYSINSGATFNISSNIKWKATLDSTWLDVKLSSDSGNSTIPVFTLSTHIGTDRFATIYILDETDNLLDSIIIKQKGASQFLLVDSLNLAFGPDSLVSDTLLINANVSWKLTSTSTWYSFNPASDSGNAEVIITIDPNASIHPRKDSILINSTANVPGQKIEVFQAGNMYVSTSNLKLTQAAGSFENFKAASFETINLSSPNSWINVSSNILAGKPDSILVKVEANSANTFANNRIGYVLLNDSWQQDTLWVEQETSTPYFQVSSDTVYLDKSQGSKVGFGLITNSSWSLTENTSWLLSNPTFGVNSDSIFLVAATKNNNGNPRSATIRLSAPGFADIEVLVIQKASEALLSVSRDSILLGSDSGDFETFSISSNLINWEIKNQASWLSVSPSTGGFTQLIKVMAVDSNDSKSIRVENIELKAPPFAPIFIKVFQDTLLPVGIASHSLKNNLLIYPNPSDGNFNLEFTKPITKTIKISIVNLIGEELSYFELDNLQNKIHLDLRSFDPGIYFMNIQSGNEYISKKISIIY